MNQNRFFLLCSLFLILISQNACFKPIRFPEWQKRTPEEARLRLQKEGNRRRQMSGLIQAKMDGVQGLLAKADVDMIVERPARMLVSVRSFFETPLYVFATDGVTATLLDGSHDGISFFKGPVNGNVLKSLLQISMWPQEAVGIFLGAASTEGTAAIQLVVDENLGIYDLGLRSSHGPIQVIRARLLDDALLQVKMYHATGKLHYQVNYSDIREVEGIPVAHHLTFGIPHAKDEKEGHLSKIHFIFKDVKLNDAPFDDAAFKVSLPLGATFRSLGELYSGAGSAAKSLE